MKEGMSEGREGREEKSRDDDYKGQGRKAIPTGRRKEQRALPWTGLDYWTGLLDYWTTGGLDLQRIAPSAN